MENKKYLAETLVTMAKNIGLAHMTGSTYIDDYLITVTIEKCAVEEEEDE